MATLEENEYLGGLNFPRGEAITATQMFGEILSKNNPVHFKNIAEKAARLHAQQKVILTGQIQEKLISRALVDIILNQPHHSIFPNNRTAISFICLFIRIWQNCNPTERNKLLGQLVSGLKDSRAFASLYFELVVAFTYAHRGTSIDFPDLGISRIPGCDLVISSPLLSFDVEIKTIDHTSGLPFNVEWVGDAVADMMRGLSRSLPENCHFIVEINHIGKRQPTHKEIADEFSTIGEKLKESGERRNLNHFSAKLSKKDPADLEKMKSFLEKAETNGNSEEYIAQVWVNHKSTQGVATIQIDSTWDLPEKIAATIADSKRQLNGRRPSILWIQMKGSTPDGGHTFGRLRRMLQFEPKILAAVKKRQAQCKEFLGIHLAGDPFTFQPQGDFDFCVDVKSAFASSSVDNPYALNVYTLYVMKSLPSEIGSLATR